MDLNEFKEIKKLLRKLKNENKNMMNQKYNLKYNSIKKKYDLFDLFEEYELSKDEREHMIILLNKKNKYK